MLLDRQKYLEYKARCKGVRVARSHSWHSVQRMWWINLQVHQQGQTYVRCSPYSSRNFASKWRETARRMLVQDYETLTAQEVHLSHVNSGAKGRKIHVISGFNNVSLLVPRWSLRWHNKTLSSSLGNEWRTLFSCAQQRLLQLLH